MAAKKKAVAPKVRQKREKKPNLTKPDKPVRAKKSPELSRRALFVKEYLIDLNGRAAAVRAGYSEATARQIAYELLGLPEVREAVDKGMEARAKRTEITADKVLERMWAIATAPASELIEMRRACCRYCWGKNNRYQRTPREMAESIREFERAQLMAEAKGEPFSHEFDPQGGLGFDPRKDPSKDCPECFGQGVEIVFPKDTRDLSADAKLLYAGVKTTQHGLEIKTHDQAGMLINVGKHLGMFTERTLHGNDPNNPLPTPMGVILVPAKRPTEDDE